METEKRKEFIEELKLLCKKYEIKNAAFTGADETNFIGLQCLNDKPTLGEIFESVNNVGRLYQSSRELIRELLNDYEKKL